MVRGIVVNVAALVGVLVVVGEVAVCPPPPPQQPPVPGQPPPPEVWVFIFMWIVTFYGAAYLTGRFLYWVLGSVSEGEELRQWAHWYLVGLHVVAGLFAIAGGWQGMGNATVLRPSLVVGLLLVGVAGWDGWHFLWGNRPKEDPNHEPGLPPGDQGHDKAKAKKR
jgi:hypothetical protein